MAPMILFSVTCFLHSIDFIILNNESVYIPFKLLNNLSIYLYNVINLELFVELQ